jgi:hypothetical protein
VLPPICSAPEDTVIAPLTARVATCVPLTKIRSVVPSYVAARCDHVLTGSAAVPVASRSAVVKTCALGADGDPPAYSE